MMEILPKKGQMIIDKRTLVPLGVVATFLIVIISLVSFAYGMKSQIEVTQKQVDEISDKIVPRPEYESTLTNINQRLERIEDKIDALSTQKTN